MKGDAMDHVQPPVDILYEDNHLLCVAKPPNLPTQADASGDADLLTLLKEYVRVRYNKPGEVYLGLVHRLDRPVGGCMVFARTSKAAKRLNDSQKAGQFQKVYLALCMGKTPRAGELTNYLVRDDATHSSRLCDKHTPGAKEARLRYERLTFDGDLSLVKIQLGTGRHHQIRVQFAGMGHPLWGDQRYNPAARPGEQLALWAAWLTFPHPVKKEPVRLFCPPAGPAWQRVSDRFIDWEIPVLYQDEALLAVEKPVGMEVTSDLADAVARTFPGAQPLHRIDVMTGGIVLFAKTAACFDLLSAAFASHQVKKTYTAQTVGVPRPMQADLRAWLKKDEERSVVTVLDHPAPGALTIETSYAVVREQQGIATLSIQLHTGRTHQIRAHLAHIGYPLVGDDKYGDRATNRRLGVKTQRLWASQVAFSLPKGSALDYLNGVTIQSEPPWM